MHPSDVPGAILYQLEEVMLLMPYVMLLDINALLKKNEVRNKPIGEINFKNNVNRLPKDCTSVLLHFLSWNLLCLRVFVLECSFACLFSFE